MATMKLKIYNAMNRTLLTLLIGLGAGITIVKLLESQRGQEWKEKLGETLAEFGEEIKNRIVAEIEKVGRIPGRV